MKQACWSFVVVENVCRGIVSHARYAICDVSIVMCIPPSVQRGWPGSKEGVRIAAKFRATVKYSVRNLDTGWVFLTCCFFFLLFVSFASFFFPLCVILRPPAPLASLRKDFFEHWSFILVVFQVFRCSMAPSRWCNEQPPFNQRRNTKRHQSTQSVVVLCRFVVGSTCISGWEGLAAEIHVCFEK